MSKKKVANSLGDSTPAPTSAKIKSDPMNDYETRDHLDTLIKAHGIMADADKMKKVHALAGRHHKAITSIKDIKDAYNTKFGPKKKALVVDSDEDEA